MGPPDVAEVVASVRERVLAAVDDGELPVTVGVPPATIGGRSADRVLVEALVIDDLRRRGLNATPTGGGEVHVAP